ncbi:MULTISPECIES: hypothetical protein [unclassified Coleofasciculus]|uniref:hypothetical protein n=1 Tax=Cyanophyceae TaxID=3028117 RepID=UPI0016843C97|nr:MULTISPECIES: hypothetical protein [unclassified Coleofasciculus]MBD1896461.1 hypothetical protein [Coleofasciculus sp. FACHB-129]MBD2088043.1 hypothetical protein [Coleofasciculus sp. FACHB-542]
MPVQICPLDSAIAELFAQATYTGSITLADRYGLMAALLQDAISEEDQRAIDRLLYAVRKNRLKVVDEISALI